MAFAGIGKNEYRDEAGFGNVGVKAVWTPRKDVTLDFGVNNVGDKWYELADGMPMPGRSWFANASYRF